MSYPLKEDGKFQYVEEGEGEVLLLLHGLFGALSNFQHLVEYFSKQYKVVIPLLPIYELPLTDMTITALVKHVEKFVAQRKIEKAMVLGNSLGGHIALVYALRNEEKVKAIILTGSSGLFESSLGGTFPKRGDYQYIKERTAYTFYDPNMATKELVDEVFETVNNRSKAIRVIATAKSAMKHNLAGDLPKIKAPTLLIWGREDTITPPEVGEEFQKLIPNAELKFIDKCGHAPMMEKPEEFNKLLDEFLKKINTPST